MSTHVLTRPHTSRFDPSLMPAGTDAVATCSVAATKWQLDFDNPVQVIGLPVDFLVAGQGPTACVQNSPTRLTLTYAVSVATGVTSTVTLAAALEPPGPLQVSE